MARSNPKAWILNLVDRCRTSFWFVPGALTVSGAILAKLALSLDESLSEETVRALPLIQLTSPESARSVLATLTGSIITLTGTIFSIVIVALTLASSQFGPRLLRGFMRDRNNQVTLGSLTGTFMYCLLTLNSIGVHGETVFVPEISMTIAIALASLNVFILVWFIHHVSTSIHASSIVASVASELLEQVEILFPKRLGSEPESDGAEFIERFRRAPSHSVTSEKSGYLRLVDAAELIEIATATGRVIDVAVPVGEFVIAGQTLVRLEGDGQPDESTVSRLRRAFSLGNHRTPVQDLGYPIEQLVEMALRALSPGINDPATAVSCVHRLGEGLSALGARRIPSAVRQDEEGTPRVIIPVAGFDERIQQSFGRIVAAATDHPIVVRAVGSVLKQVGEIAPRRHPAIREGAARLGLQLDADA